MDFTSLVVALNAFINAHKMYPDASTWGVTGMTTWPTSTWGQVDHELKLHHGVALHVIICAVGSNRRELRAAENGTGTRPPRALTWDALGAKLQQEYPFRILRTLSAAERKRNRQAAEEKERLARARGDYDDDSYDSGEDDDDPSFGKGPSLLGNPETSLGYVGRVPRGRR